MLARTVSTREELGALQPAWTALAARRGTPALSHDWFAACADAAPELKPCVVVIEEDGVAIAIAPLVISSHFGAPTLHMLGDPLCKLCEASGFLYRDEAALRALVQAISSMRKPMRLEKLNAASLEGQVLSSGAVKGVNMKPRMSKAVFVPLESDWSAFEAKIAKSKLQEIRRRTRRAGEIGAVRFEAISPTPENLAPHLEQLIAVEASGWKARERSAIASNPYQRRFFESFAAAAARSGELRIFFLWFGERLAAAYLAVEHGGRLWGLKTGHDEAFRKLAPGILIAHEMLRYAVERGLTVYEFMGAEEAWETTWPGERHDFASFRIYPFSVAGMWGFAVDTCAWLNARLKERLARPGAGA